MVSGLPGGQAPRDRDRARKGRKGRARAASRENRLIQVKRAACPDEIETKACRPAPLFPRQLRADCESVRGRATPFAATSTHDSIELRNCSGREKDPTALPNGRGRIGTLLATGRLNVPIDSDPPIGRTSLPACFGSLADPSTRLLRALRRRAQNLSRRRASPPTARPC